MYGIDEKEMARVAKPEPMKTQLGLKAIRRKNANGYHYFIANLTPDDIEARVPLAVDFKGARWFNPLNGDISLVDYEGGNVAIQLRSGESMILQVYDDSMGGTLPKPVSTCLHQAPLPLPTLGPRTTETSTSRP